MKSGGTSKRKESYPIVAYTMKAMNVLAASSVPFLACVRLSNPRSDGRNTGKRSGQSLLDYMKARRKSSRIVMDSHVSRSSGGTGMVGGGRGRGKIDR